jgi:uncharacterized protein
MNGGSKLFYLVASMKLRAISNYTLEGISLINVKDEKQVWEDFEKHIQGLNLDESDKKIIFSNILSSKKQKINILITGATGSGKSTTINSVFDTEVAKIGYGVNPETKDIAKYEFENLVLWDTPGLGDGISEDRMHTRNIINKLREKDKGGFALIDLVLVIIDGSSKDLGTAYSLINEVIIPNMKETDRILVAINQCDIAMKGRGWVNNKPNEELERFLDEKAYSVERRIYESTGVRIKPIYYSAFHCYNLTKLLSFIVKYTPVEKRLVYARTIHKNHDHFKRDDGRINYREEIARDVDSPLTRGLSNAAKGAAAGAAIGSFIPGVGTVGGALIGAGLGFLGGLFEW